jgi:hypothetical protein
MMRRVHRQALVRWLILLGAAAGLTWLGLFAGQARTPGAIKRGWAVTASRVMALGAGFLVLRIVMFSPERRIPVVLLDSGAGGLDLDRAMKAAEDLARAGYEPVPLADVTAHIRDGSYVPGKCVSFALAVGTAEELARVLETGRELKATILLPPGALEGTGPDTPVVPPGTEVALDLRKVEPSSVADRVRVGSHLRDFTQSLEERLNVRARYAAANRGALTDPRATLTATGYDALLDGEGFNRYGDRPHLVRLLDLTGLVQRGKSRISILAAVELFKGKYLWLPICPRP